MKVIVGWVLCGLSCVTLFLLYAYLCVKSEQFPSDLVEWREFSRNPILGRATERDWDFMLRERSSIIILNGVYHLWYCGFNRSISRTPQLGHATSLDGITWKKDSRNPLLNGAHIEDICIVQVNKRLFMFAEGENDIAHSLISDDGLSWVEMGPIDIRNAGGKPIEAGPYGTPTVWHEDGIWYMFYERQGLAVWLASSVDGVVWKNVKDSPVLVRGPGGYDSAKLGVDYVLKRSGYYYIYYYGSGNKHWKMLSISIARSRDLLVWEKYDGNPIIGNDRCSVGFVDIEGELRLFTSGPDLRLYVQDK